MKIGVIEKSSFIDYPGIVSAVLFLRGCNRRCEYCHNKELWYAEGECIPENEVLSFLESKKGLLQGVVFSGGEPLLQLEELIPFMRKVKALGYKIKLDTNGDWPLCLERVLNEKLVDFVAIDLNFMRESPRFTECIEAICKSGVEWEARTTLFWTPIIEFRLDCLAALLPPGGKWYWQRVRNSNLRAPSKESLEKYAAKFKGLKIGVR